MSSQFPHFIEDKLVHTSNLNISRKQRTKLALVRTLQFYEVNQKQIINEIDLQTTILHKVQFKIDSIEQEFNEIKSQASENFACFKTCPSTPKIGGITIGKYVYQTKSEILVYILIQCWNSMVVIKKDSNGFSLQAEYEDVKSFHVSKESKYQASVLICFIDKNRNETTNFQDLGEDLVPIDIPSVNVYTKMIDRIKIKQSEYLVHQTMTKKEFAKLKNIAIFGSNSLRTPRLEELQILSKCSNVWIKLTANDDVVIGVPIVNNCSSRLTVLRNFRAVLQSLQGDSTYTFKLYQLEKSFNDLENLESFFNDTEESSDKERYPVTSNWEECSDFCLRPEEFGILLINLKIDECFSESGMDMVSLFAFYDISASNKTFNQKCLLTTLSLRDIFTNNTCRLKFDEQNLHRDVLTIMTSSFKSTIRIEFIATGSTFEHYLCQKLGFFKVYQTQNFSEPMHVDRDEDVVTDDVSNNAKLILYNKNQDSIWHGTLLEVTQRLNDASLLDVRIFTKSYSKCRVFIKQLRMDLKANLGIRDVEENVKTLSTKLIEFEAALRDECLACLDIFASSAMRTKTNRKEQDSTKRLYNGLHLKQFKTDLVFRDLL